MYDPAESFLHMFCLVDLIIIPFVMKPKHRNSEFINHIRIDFTIVINPCHTYSPSGHAKLGSIKTAVIIF